MKFVTQLKTGVPWFCLFVCMFLWLGPSSGFSAESLRASKVEILAQTVPTEQSAEGPNSKQQEKRIYLVGGVCGAVFGVVLILFGYFRLDNATRGFYSGRLQTLALVAIVILLGLAAWFTRLFVF